MEEVINISNDVAELSILAEKVEIIGEKWELSMPLTMNINLVLEEAVSNIIFYAFDDNKRHTIKTTIRLNKQVLFIQIEDDGIAFNPTVNKKPDISLSAEDRPIGGLGIFLISKIMDEVTYLRKQEKNILTLHKNINL